MKKLLYIAMTCAFGFTASSALAEATTIQGPATKPAAPKAEKISVYSIAFKGGGWGAVSKARAALKSLSGVTKVLVSGNFALVQVEPSATLAKDAVAASFKKKRLTIVSMSKGEHNKPTKGVSYVGMGPGWASTIEKARAALCNVEGVEFVLMSRRSVQLLLNGDSYDEAKVKSILANSKFKTSRVKPMTHMPL